MRPWLPLLCLWVPACSSNTPSSDDAKLVVVGLDARDAELALDLWGRIEVADDFRDWHALQGEGQWLTNPNFPGFEFQNRANDTLVAALVDWTGTAPADSILVKHTWNPERQRFGAHAMWKVPGYAPAGGDWFWLHLRYDDDAQSYARAVPHEVDRECVSCHRAGEDWLLSALW